MNIKAIIFDWGRTLFDVDNKKNYRNIIRVKKYNLDIINERQAFV